MGKVLKIHGSLKDAGDEAARNYRKLRPYSRPEEARDFRAELMAAMAIVDLEMELERKDDE